MIAANASRSKNPLRNEIRKKLRQKLLKRRQLRGKRDAKALANKKWNESGNGKLTESNVEAKRMPSFKPALYSGDKESQKSLLDWLAYEPKTDVKFPPTSALPGSAEKIDVLADRYEQGLPLWHAQDFQYCGTDSQVDG